MNQSIKLTGILTVAALLGSPAYGAGPSAAMLAGACAACHGPGGISAGPATPSIAGMTSEYLEISMQDYKSDARKSTVMNRIAKGYTDEEIKMLADYFAGLEYASVKQEADSAMASKGDELQQTYCNSCHEGSGTKADGIGILAGQAIPYLSYTIADFQSGDRPMERRKKQKMDQLVRDAGEDGFHAIVQYYGSQ